MGYGTFAYGTSTYGGGSGVPAIPAPFNGLCIFETPQVRDRPPYLPNSTPREVGLMRHFENRLRGVLVFQNSDGTFSQDTPSNYESAQTNPAAGMSFDVVGPDETTTIPSQSNSAVAFPWNPFPGSTNSEIPGSYVYSTNWDQTVTESILNPYIVRFHEGGAENVITQAEALTLTAAGYGDCIKVAPPGTVYTAHQYAGNVNQ